MKIKPDFEELVAEHGRGIFAYLWRLLGDNKLAEDCLQDVFLRAFVAYGRLDRGSNYRAWLYKIATNQAYSLREREARISKRQVVLDDALPALDQDPQETYDKQEKLERIARAVMALPEMQRAAIVLRKYQEFAYSEIATILECSESSARANVYQGLKTLRKRFSPIVMKGLSDEEQS